MIEKWLWCYNSPHTDTPFCSAVHRTEEEAKIVYPNSLVGRIQESRIEIKEKIPYHTVVYKDDRHPYPQNLNFRADQRELLAVWKTMEISSHLSLIKFLTIEVEE